MGQVANLQGYNASSPYGPYGGYGSYQYYAGGPGAGYANQANPYTGLTGQAQNLYNTYGNINTWGYRGALPNIGNYQAPDWNNPQVQGSMNSWRNMLQKSGYGQGLEGARVLANARANVPGALRFGGGMDPYADYAKGLVGSIADNSANLMREGYGNLVDRNKWNYGLETDRYNMYRQMISDRLNAFNELMQAKQQEENWNLQREAAIKASWDQQAQQELAAKNWGMGFIDWQNQATEKAIAANKATERDQMLRNATSTPWGAPMGDARLQDWAYLQATGYMPYAAGVVSPQWQPRG